MIAGIVTPRPNAIFSGRPCRLHDVVLEDGRVASAQLRVQAEERDRDHRNRNRRADREPDLEHQVQ
jgi:hypothetical protein